MQVSADRTVGRAVDRIVVVDWSASSRPTTGADSIWIATLDRVSGAVATTNPRTRALAVDVIVDVCARPGRTVVGVDFSLGYPAGTAAALGLDGVPWRAMWTLLADLVVDAPDNTNNRFDVATELNRRMGDGPGPFWGCPPNRSSAWLTATKTSPAPIPEWRTTEAVVRERGHRPFTAWQLLGAGSVGSQSLVGIPALVRVEAALRRAGRTVDVWPFTAPAVSSPAAAPGDVVIGEVWPSLYPLGALDGRVRDEVQVIQTAHRLHHDIDRSPIHRFDECVVREEGWVWGA